MFYCLFNIKIKIKFKKMSVERNLFVRTESDDQDYSVFSTPTKSPSLSSIVESFRRSGGSTSSQQSINNVQVPFRKTGNFLLSF